MKERTRARIVNSLLLYYRKPQANTFLYRPRTLGYHFLIPNIITRNLTYASNARDSPYWCGNVTRSFLPDHYNIESEEDSYGEITSITKKSLGPKIDESIVSPKIVYSVKR